MAEEGVGPERKQGKTSYVKRARARGDLLRVGSARLLPLAATFRVHTRHHLVSHTMINHSIQTCRSRAFSLRAA